MISVNQQNTNGDNNAEIKKEIGPLEHRDNKNIAPKKEGINYFKIFIVVLIGTVIFWGLSLLSYFIVGFAISETSIVLTFIGILTTFILISNYAQVKEIKDDFERDKRELYNRIETLEKEVSKLAAKVDIAKLKGELYNASNDYKKYIDNLFSQKRNK